MKNIGESIVARLRNKARADGVDTQFLLNRYALERFMYRLSISQHADSFCLKGGLLVAVWNEGDLFRPTNDIDLNGFDADGDITRLEAVVREVALMDANDGVRFDVDSMSVRKAREGFVAGGKVEMNAYVHRSRVRVRADVGFGNAITPDASVREYPSMLEVPRPVIQMYPPETVVAEKLHAMARHGIDNSRLKDYYDIWLLSRRVDIDRATLTEAIARTFECHETEIPSIEEFEALSDEYAVGKAKAWGRYVNNSGLSERPPGLGDVLGVVRRLVVTSVQEARERQQEPLPTPAP